MSEMLKARIKFFKKFVVVTASERPSLTKQLSRRVARGTESPSPRASGGGEPVAVAATRRFLVREDVHAHRFIVFITNGAKCSSQRDKNCKKDNEKYRIDGYARPCYSRRRGRGGCVSSQHPAAHEGT